MINLVYGRKTGILIINFLLVWKPTCIDQQYTVSFLKETPFYNWKGRFSCPDLMLQRYIFEIIVIYTKIDITDP